TWPTDWARCSTPRSGSTSRTASAGGAPATRPRASRPPARPPPPAPAPPARGEDEFYGYGVDAGTGCFYDASADGAFPDCEGDEGPLWDAFEDSKWAPGPHRVTSPDAGHDLIAFSSGWGDGAYPTWIGRDAAGEITCFLTDFFVAPDPTGT
ncbi:DUF4241 domain-containing protein, partial [Streptomyces sp. NPDC059597]|uniref:DUF4241 domain-containing protein n=1 Tax=Streptomyces sp. NPDC059597 TaxID=3346879 RepID=UPI0036B5F8CC